MSNVSTSASVIFSDKTFSFQRRSETISWFVANALLVEIVTLMVDTWGRCVSIIVSGRRTIG